MNRLVIIGNGFDLSLGLKTSYNDFLTHYFQELVTEMIHRTNWRRDIVIDSDLGNIYQGGDELCLIKLPEFLFRSSEREKFLEKIKSFEDFREIFSFLNNNGSIEFKFTLLEKIRENSLLNNWVDFEVMYYDTLMELYNDVMVVDVDRRENLINEFQDKFELFKNKFIDYLTNIDFNYRDNKVMDFYSRTSKRFTENLVLNKPIEKIMLLSFNYTQSVKEFKKFIHDVDCEVNYIHGNLEDKNSVIFGFGDELDEDYTTIERERTQELFKNIKSVHYFKYPNYNQLYSFIGFSEEYEVYIYGHSCGISDRTLLNEIFENENCTTIRIFYHKFNESEDNFQDISVGLIRQFTDKSRMRQIVLSKQTKDTMTQLKS